MACPEPRSIIVPCVHSWAKCSGTLILWRQLHRHPRNNFSPIPVGGELPMKLCSKLFWPVPNVFFDPKRNARKLRSCFLLPLKIIALLGFAGLAQGAVTVEVNFTGWSAFQQNNPANSSQLNVSVLRSDQGSNLTEHQNNRAGVFFPDKDPMLFHLTKS